ncbi:MAG TPA: hypothetical protein VEG39_12990 [Clostridia bacterium]|nr:hypothetical protein [Clostridia bacterium]
MGKKSGLVSAGPDIPGIIRNVPGAIRADLLSAFEAGAAVHKPHPV